MECLSAKEIKFPYNMEEIMPIIAEEVDKTDSKTVINLTGGTKPWLCGFEISRARDFLKYCRVKESHLRIFMFGMTMCWRWRLRKRSKISD